ncbi:YihY/virulence factor BrkB family protein [Nesterenkonia sp. LB17]|uniref:YihY/virulence factor BrkB family protein n=1 Tax=unclassified Nesterenkonia TaxID=2629769 RepID=UPI001F4C615E|nr:MULTISPECIES: YihY/virulence factor BrkB family protein [unclassified Nesterenkonia]MCH8559781.1 YihY/virulence factor BrkB family protein [Nesterenkonia sp. DZ6]MCH8561945.1 YihY/virulence factor BrkB family protein [Nesterenkonia sp. YGD6]MCH8564518.1 YihY/virulence factor BrkB family protein [Nesterenkonia sp. LB17]MCH8570144.1 YihY/virulence factor BrkB family protein [Nesterenkonia sp. AY15]
MSAHSDPQGHPKNSNPAGRAAGALKAHRAPRHQIEDGGRSGATVHQGDQLRVGTLSAAADQPFMVKNRQREDFEESISGDSEDHKTSSPVKLTGTTWKYSAKRTLTEFGRDSCTDLAAGLTYYTVLSVFPALIALVSLMSFVGEGERTQEFLLSTAAQMLESDTMEQIRPAIEAITSVEGAGIGLALGLLTALWTASNYVNAFSRSMNRVYEVEEGRSLLKLRPIFYLVTAGLLVLVATAVFLLLISGPIARAVGDTVGLGETAVTIFNWATYPALLIVAVICIAMLYHVTPNLRQPGVRWISAGAVLAILVMVLATAAVFFYVSNFGNYEATYGALAGVIIFLIWVYIMNLVLLLGAEFDSELERGRQLQSGIEAERTIMLPPRDMGTAEKKSKKYEDLVAQGQALRMTQGETSDPEASWRR